MLQSYERIRLANFFERLATVGVGSEEWQKCLSTHYLDPMMEKARCLVVRLTLHYSFEERLSILKIKTGDIELCHQIQSIAAYLCNPDKGVKVLLKEEWWLDWYVLDDDQFVDVTWAKIQVFNDLLAEVFDMDGRTMYFEDEASAANELSEDDYRRLTNLDEEDEQDLGISLNDLEPPVIYDKQALKPLMQVRFQRKL
jgi:hypothetical protein